MQDLTSLYLLQKLINKALVDIEVSNPTARIFFSRITEQIEFGLIHAQDSPIGSDPMHSNDGGLKEISYLSSRDVSFDAHITERLSQAIAHRKGRQLKLTFFSVFGAAGNFSAKAS